MSAPMPSVPSASRSSERLRRGPARPSCSCSSGRCARPTRWPRGRARARASSRWTPCASSVRSSSTPEPRQPLDRRRGRRGPRRRGCAAAPSARRTRRSVSSESVKEACAPTSAARRAAGARGAPARGSGGSRRCPALRPLGPVAVGGLVAEHRADAERPQRVLDHVERAVDRVRRGVVVDERRRAGEQRLHPADERRRADRVLVERSVEAPPDPLQDLQEALGRLERVGHPARERRVEMGVRADVAGDDEAARAVDAASPAAGRGDAAVLDPAGPPSTTGTGSSD